ncbi:MAG: phosphohistidine phosphatase SixA [Acidobacteria bacterium]|nr:MAG: phosphohistidine phosphatase SixA [Acidobacteriota bacterium]
MPGTHHLYLIRHGVAEERGDAWPDDAKRPLSDAGISRTRKAARGLAAFGVTFDVVLTSPLARARQTAEIIAATYDPRPAIVAVDWLAPGVSIATALADLEKHARRTDIALVGHEPGIGELAARLVGSQHPLEFKKAAACRIDVGRLPPTGPGVLRWFVTARMLRQIKK